MPPLSAVLGDQPPATAGGSDRIKMTITITEIETHDVRFPTSRTLDGSDAVNVDPDYSAAYVILRTDSPGLEGHGLTFTNGRGNDVACAAIEALGPRVKGRTLESNCC